jgi:phosphohistidine phosphatase
LEIAEGRSMAGIPMKKILLLRHAKSSWKDSQLRDIERPLNERGRKAAVLIGGYIRDQRLGPDLVLCSPAQRTRETAALVLETAGIKAELRFDERIYEASSSVLFEVVTEIEENRNEVMLIGHNPGLEDLLAFLTGASEHMPTSSLARILLKAENWKEVRARQADLEWFVKPKELARR